MRLFIYLYEIMFVSINYLRHCRSENPKLYTFIDRTSLLGNYYIIKQHVFYKNSEVSKNGVISEPS